MFILKYYLKYKNSVHRITGLITFSILDIYETTQLRRWRLLGLSYGPLIKLVPFDYYLLKRIKHFLNMAALIYELFLTT